MANLLTDILTTAAYTVTGSFATITGMTDTVSIDGPGSVILIQAALTPDSSGSGDECAEYRLTVDGSPVGPVLSAFSDDIDNVGGRSQCWQSYVRG